MEKELSLTHPMEWEASAPESVVTRESGQDGGIGFFRGVIVATLISLPLWGATAWLLLAWSGK